MGRISGSGKAQSGSLAQLGISPRRLALTLALGFAIGCIPVIGIPTVLLRRPGSRPASKSTGNSSCKLCRHAAAVGPHRSLCPVRRLDHVVARLRQIGELAGSSRARALLGYQPRLPHQRNGRPGVAGVARSRHSGSLVDDGSLQPDAAPHSRLKPLKRVTETVVPFLIFANSERILRYSCASFPGGVPVAISKPIGMMTR